MGIGRQPVYTSFDQVGTKREGVHKGGIKQQYILDDRGRRLLLSLYDGTSERIDELERLMHIPRWKIRHWASQLALTRQKEPFWTAEDEEYLARNLHRKSIADIAQTLGRTKTAVKVKAKRLGINKTIQEGYTMRGLCLALGCDHHKIEKWLKYGWIKGQRRQSERVSAQGGDIWFFTDSDVRSLVIAHPNEIDQRRCDWLWMVDLLAGGNNYGIGSLAKTYGEREKN